MHWLYTIIPPARKDTSAWNWLFWALLGNDDDGIFGEGPRSGDAWLAQWGNELSLKRFWAWQTRNPLHNFFFYVIGSADREVHTRHVLLIGGQHEDSGGMWPFGAYGYYVGLHDGKPFISFRVVTDSSYWEGY